LSLQGEKGKRRGERKTKAVCLDWDDWVVILFMTAMRGQWRILFSIFMFACVKDLMVVILMGVYHSFGDEKARENLCKTEGLGKGGNEWWMFFFYKMFSFLIYIIVVAK
jgi:hypothetical protein